MLERIARFADIDTRRAMGFGPRRLPPSSLEVPFHGPEFVETGLGFARRVVLNERTQLYVNMHGDETTWVFGADDFMKSRTYCFERNGRVTQYRLNEVVFSVHPDFKGRVGSESPVVPEA